jgi:gentisate 1,2-dioxygenase
MSAQPASGAHPLWDHMFDLHAAELERKRHAQCVVERDSTPQELTPLGFVRWYLHPRRVEVVSRTMYFLELEIPAGSRSGLLRHQGSLIHLVVQGSGYTTLNGTKHAWEADDVIGIPPRPNGVEVQHFSDDAGPARLVMAWPNMDGAMGPGLGVDFAILEAAPEYQT